MGTGGKWFGMWPVGERGRLVGKVGLAYRLDRIGQFGQILPFSGIGKVVEKLCVCCGYLRTAWWGALEQSIVKVRDLRVAWGVNGDRRFGIRFALFCGSCGCGEVGERNQKGLLPGC